MERKRKESDIHELHVIIHMIATTSVKLDFRRVTLHDLFNTYCSQGYVSPKEQKAFVKSYIALRRLGRYNETCTASPY